jgi:hypothetical protein
MLFIFGYEYSWTRAVFVTRTGGEKIRGFPV